jgi:hypothetical protein
VEVENSLVIVLVPVRLHNRPAFGRIEAFLGKEKTMLEICSYVQHVSMVLCFILLVTVTIITLLLLGDVSLLWPKRWVTDTKAFWTALYVSIILLCLFWALMIIARCTSIVLVSLSA